MHQKKNFSTNLINKQPVWFDVALTRFFIVACKIMIFVFCFQRTAIRQNIDYLKQFIKIFILLFRSVYKELHADHETGLLTTKQAEYQAPGKCEIFSLFCCLGFPKGLTPWHTTLLAKCSVLYALSALLRK